jgi:hypothetical protein
LFIVIREHTADRHYSVYRKNKGPYTNCNIINTKFAYKYPKIFGEIICKFLNRRKDTYSASIKVIFSPIKYKYIKYLMKINLEKKVYFPKKHNSAIYSIAFSLK